MEASRRRSWVVRCALTSVWLVSVVTIGPSAASGQSGGELAYPLQGTRWRLTEYIGAGQTRPPGPEVDAWIRLGEGRMTGSTGCAKLRGSYVVGPEAAVVGSEATPAPSVPLSVDPSSQPDPSADPSFPDDTRVAFADVRSGGRDCAEQTMLVVEGMLDGLAQTAGFLIAPASPAWTSTLELIDASGAPVLRFRVDDAGTVAGSTWLLESIDGRPARSTIEGQPAVLTFDAGGSRPCCANVPGQDGSSARLARLRLSGSTGCNAFSGRYFATGSVLSIGELATTTDPCSPPQTEQEIAILGILGGSSLRVTLPPDALELRSDDDERVLRYRAAVPLEGQQWVLPRLRAKRLGTDEVVTLSLIPDDPDSTADIRTGTLAGEGPCRPYAGTYRTDGLLLQLRAVVPDDGPCATRGPERRYLRALRQAAFGEVDGGTLRLRDELGRELIGFVTPGLP